MIGTVDFGRPYSLVMAASEFSSSIEDDLIEAHDPYIDTLPLSQIVDPISDAFDSERVLLESRAQVTVHKLRLELNRLEDELRRKEQQERITLLVDSELQRIRLSQVEREVAEKTRLELIYRSFLTKEEVPVFQTSAYLRPPQWSSRASFDAEEAFDVDAILRRNQRRLRTLNNM